MVLRQCSSLTYAFAGGGFLLGLHLLHWLVSVSLDGLLWDRFVRIIDPSGAGWPPRNLRICDTILLHWPHLRSLRGLVKWVGSEHLFKLSRIWRGAAQLWIVEGVGVTADLHQWRQCVSRRAAGLIISVVVRSPWRSALVVRLPLLKELHPFCIMIFKVPLVRACGSSRAPWSFWIDLGRLLIWCKGWGFTQRDVEGSVFIQYWRSYLKDRKNTQPRCVASSPLVPRLLEDLLGVLDAPVGARVNMEISYYTGRRTTQG